MRTSNLANLIPGVAKILAATQQRVATCQCCSGHGAERSLHEGRSLRVRVRVPVASQLYHYYGIWGPAACKSASPRALLDLQVRTKVEGVR